MKPISILKYVTPFLVVAILFSIWHFKRKIVTVSETRLMLGTFVEITVIGGRGDDLAGAVEAAFLRIAEIEAIADRYTGSSEISELNRNAAVGRLVDVPVSDDILEMLTVAKMVSEISNRAFDITVAPVVDLWDFTGDGGGKIPDGKEIGERLKLVDCGKIVVEDGTISSEEPGIKLDLGGVAKGYAADEAAEVLIEAGVKSGVINAGGDMVLIGSKGRAGGKTPWRIGVQDPRDSNGLIALLKLKDTSVVTSGDYERYFIVDGRRYHHIIDPKTGYPSNASISVTIVAESAAFADALATAVFVLGPQKGIDLVEELDSVEALVMGADGGISVTTGLSDLIEYED